MLLHKGAEWVWGAAQEEAFSTLKQRLVAKPIPALFEPELETRLYTDASRIGLAGILAQVKDGKEFVVSYFSRHTTSAEQNYNSLELETLAIVASVKRFRQFLWGRSFTIYTDCAAVRSTFLKKDVNARVGRWVLELSEFQYQIRHKGNQQMRHADALSRNPPTHEYGINAAFINEDDWLLVAQQPDKAIQGIKKILQSGNRDQNKDVFSKYALKGGKAFDNHAFKTFCQEHGIRIHYNATALPRGNGQVERYNRTLLESMSTMGADADDDEWVQNLPNIQLGLNDTVNSAIRVTPSETLMGNSLFPGHVRGRRARGGGRDQGP
jgi:hypothetical protein